MTHSVTSPENSIIVENQNKKDDKNLNISSIPIKDQVQNPSHNIANNQFAYQKRQSQNQVIEDHKLNKSSYLFQQTNQKNGDWEGVDDSEELARKQVRERVKNTKFYSYILIDNRWKPEIRESHSMAVINNCLYLYGGSGIELYHTLSFITPEFWKWKNMDQDGDFPSEGRQGHSMNEYKQNLVLFGGERKFNRSMKMRECFNDCRIFSPVNEKWTVLRLYGDPIENRRNHVGVIVSKYLIIYGGVDSNGKHLNDVLSINLETNKVTKQNLKENGQGIAFHAACAVFRNENKIDNINSPLEKNSRGKERQKIVHQGIYTFGGRKENGEAVGKLRILQIGSDPIKWTEPDPKGYPPIARFQHTLNFFREQNILILIGGRSDGSQSQQQSTILNDTYIFSLDFFEWIKVDMKGRGAPFRCSHSSSIIDTKLVIFGGIDNDGFCNSDLFFIELDQNKAFLFTKEHQKRILGSKDMQNLNIASHLKHEFEAESISIGGPTLFSVPYDKIPTSLKFKKKRSVPVIYGMKEIPQEIIVTNNGFDKQEGQSFQKQQKAIDIKVQQVKSSQSNQKSLEKEKLNSSLNISNPKLNIKSYLPLPFLPKKPGYIKDLALGGYEEKLSDGQVSSKKTIDNIKSILSYSKIKVEDDDNDD